MGEYLWAGGFFYVEGNPQYLGEMFVHLHRALAGEAHFTRLSPSHPVYHAFYDFRSGFPGEFKQSTANNPAYRPASHFPTADSYPLGLWGFEVDGEVAVIFSDLPIVGRLFLPAARFREAVPYARPYLHAATNIAVYALTRSQGMLERRQLPLWAKISSER